MYLIVATKEKVLLAQVHKKSASFDYETQRAAISTLFPKAEKIYSPMEEVKPAKLASRCIYLQSYLSPNKEGVGREESKFFLWAVLMPIPQPKTLKFGAMYWGQRFQDNHGRKFIKLQHILPSGLTQKYFRKVDESEQHLEFNAVDDRGTPGRCPDWLEFELLDEEPKVPQAKQFDEAGLNLLAEIKGAKTRTLDLSEKVRAGDYLVNKAAYTLIEEGWTEIGSPASSFGSFKVVRME